MSMTARSGVLLNDEEFTDCRRVAKYALTLSTSTRMRAVSSGFVDFHLGSVRLERAVLRSCTFSERTLIESTEIYESLLQDLSFHESSFNAVSFDAVDLTGTLFTSCTFRNVDFTDCDLSGVRFESCTFDDACEFLGSSLKCCSFLFCKAEGAERYGDKGPAFDDACTIDGSFFYDSDELLENSSMTTTARATFLSPTDLAMANKLLRVQEGVVGTARYTLPDWLATTGVGVSSCELPRLRITTKDITATSKQEGAVLIGSAFFTEFR